MNLLVRADSSATIGMGHVMRCLALAQAWQRLGGSVMFATTSRAKALEDLFRVESFHARYLDVEPGTDQDARETLLAAREWNARWIVADGYAFGSRYQKLLKEGPFLVLAVDDGGKLDRYYSDVIVNADLCASEGLYAHREPGTVLLLGLEYALIRREFVERATSARSAPKVARRILVTMGGGDVGDVTIKVIRALQRVVIAGMETIVVVGPANPNCAEIKSAMVDTRQGQVVRNPNNFAELTAWADLCVCAGGSTINELLFMGTPSLALILADNQEEHVRCLADLGAVVNLGWHSDVDVQTIADTVADLCVNETRRSELARVGSNLVDGEGAVRVASFMLEEADNDAGIGKPREGSL